MRVPDFVLHELQERLLPIAQERPPNEIIGPGVRNRLRDYPDGNIPIPNKDFLWRWFLVPKNRVCNMYLHQFTRDDEDRALHDHPWWNLSILLQGSYYEHTIQAGGVHKRVLYTAGDMKLRAPWHAHRIELPKEYDSLQPGTSKKPVPSWSLFITGPVQSGWGFHCPGEWRSSERFARENGCSASDGGQFPYREGARR